MVPLLKDQGGVSMNAKVKRERERCAAGGWQPVKERVVVLAFYSVKARKKKVFEVKEAAR